MKPPLARAWLAAPPAAAVVAHSSALGGGFVWLDHAHIEAGYALAKPSGWVGLFAHGFAGTGYYRPLTSLSLSIDALVGSPWLFHATTLLWHAAASLMVAVAAIAIGSTRRAAVLAGVLFAVHPAGSLVAGAIAFRSEAMIAVALLGLVAAHERRRPWLAAAAMLAGALTKETALVLAPLYVVALEATRRFAPEPARSRPAANVRAEGRLRPVLIAEAAALALAIALRLAFAPAWRAEHPELSLGEAAGTRLASIARAVATVVLPLDGSICDAFPVAPAIGVRALAGAAALALLAWLAWRRRGAWLLLALSFLPALQLVPVARWWSPHYVYVSLAFAAILLGDAIARRRAFAFAAGAAALLAVVAFTRGLRFANDESLWRPEIEAEPACREGHFYLGEALRKRRAWAEAEASYAAALAPRPGMLAYVDRAAALQNLGTVRLELDDLPAARDALAAALAVTTEPAARRRVVHDLAAVALRAGDPAECWRLLEPEVAREDALPESIYLGAKALHALHREDETRALILRLKRMGWSG